MEQPNVEVIGIGHFAQTCIETIDNYKIPEVKAMMCHHLSEYDLHKVKEFLSGEPQISIIIADLGAYPRDSMAISVVNMAKQGGGITLCVLTTPFIFEGKNAFRSAVETASNIMSISDACLVIGKEVPDAPDFSIMQMDNRIGENIYASTIGDMIKDLADLTKPSGSIKIDSNDLEQSLREQGTFVIERGRGRGHNRVSKALEEVLSSPLMRKCDVYASRNILIKILVSGQTDFHTEELSSLSNFLEGMPPYVNIKWGVSKCDDLQEEIELILLASGYDVKLPE